MKLRINPNKPMVKILSIAEIMDAMELLEEKLKVPKQGKESPKGKQSNPNRK